MNVDKLRFIKKIPQNTPFKPTTLCCLTLFLWCLSHDASLLPLLWHLQRVWLLNFWVFWKIRGCTMLTILKETRECFICTSEEKEEIAKEKETPLFKWFWCAVWSSAGIMRGGGIDEKTRYWWLSLWRDGCLMACVIMTNTASAAERSVH